MNKRIGPISQRMFPAYGNCAKCGTTWNLVRDASVQFHKCTEEARVAHWRDIFHVEEAPPRHKDTMYCAGIFALCLDCWKELTPEQRLPYYEELFWRNATLYSTFTRQELELQWEEIQTHILLDHQVLC